MTEEQHPTYPNAIEALLLIALLMAIELFVAAAVFDADLLSGVNDGDVYGFITVVGNGILFVGLMAYKRVGYRTLFHPAGHSLAATMMLVSVPILMLVPGLVMLAGAGNTLVQWLFPMDADDLARFESQMAPGIVPILFSVRGGAGARRDAVSWRDPARLPAPVLAHVRNTVVCDAVRGIAHLNLYQMMTALAIGIVAGWLYERCRSLWPCILLHAAYNGFVTRLLRVDHRASAGTDGGPRCGVHWRVVRRLDPRGVGVAEATGQQAGVTGNSCRKTSALPLASQSCGISAISAS